MSSAIELASSHVVKCNKKESHRVKTNYIIQNKT